MKRICLFFISIVFCMNVTSRDDVTKLVQKYEANKPELFWYKLGTEHPEINAMKKAIDQKKPAMQIVAQALGDMSSYRSDARRFACKDSKYVDFINLMYNITGIRDVYSKVEFFIVNNSEMNASMLPEGTCIINTGLIEKASNTEEVVAVVAHEIAHFVLWHTINDCWRTAKAIRRNQTWAEVGTVFAAGAYGASQIYSAQYGAQQSNAAQQQMYNNIYSAGVRIREEIGLRTDIFTRLRYMRETESEADETAFWFLEKNSIDPIYLINLLKKIDAQTPSYLKERKNNTKYSDHPDMANRIETLEMMYKKYHNPMYNQKSLPTLSSFKPNMSVNKEVTAPRLARIDGVTLYLDGAKVAHSDFKCESLQCNGFERTIEAGSIKEIPAFCSCVSNDIARAIHIKLSTPTSLPIQPSHNEVSVSSNAGTDSNVLNFDKKGIAHYDNKCQLLKSSGLDRVVQINSLTAEPDYCKCVTDEIRWQISFYHSVPTGY